jgi:uncharacterized protein YlxW (UPF0749 family)
MANPFSLSREGAAKAATELAEHLKLIDNVRALQVAQKELADEIRTINQRLFELHSEIRALKAETKFEALKEAQNIVNSVQSAFYERLEKLSNQVAVLSNGSGQPRLTPPKK